jgi:hypothetical protein
LCAGNGDTQFIGVTFGTKPWGSRHATQVTGHGLFVELVALDLVEALRKLFGRQQLHRAHAVTANGLQHLTSSQGLKAQGFLLRHG